MKLSAKAVGNETTKNRMTPATDKEISVKLKQKHYEDTKIPIFLFKLLGWLRAKSRNRRWHPDGDIIIKIPPVIVYLVELFLMILRCQKAVTIVKALIEFIAKWFRS